MVIKLTVMQHSGSAGVTERPSKKAPQFSLVKNRARGRWRANGRRVATPTWLGPCFLSATLGVRLSTRGYNNKSTRFPTSAPRRDETADSGKSDQIVVTKLHWRGPGTTTIIIIRKYKLNKINITNSYILKII